MTRYAIEKIKKNIFKQTGILGLLAFIQTNHDHRAQRRIRDSAFMICHPALRLDETASDQEIHEGLVTTLQNLSLWEHDPTLLECQREFAEKVRSEIEINMFGLSAMFPYFRYK